MFEGIGNVITQVARDGQFCFVPEDPLDLLFPGGFPDAGRHVKMLQRSLHFRGDAVVERCVFIGNESVKSFDHGDSPCKGVFQIKIAEKKGKRKAVGHAETQDYKDNTSKI